MPRTFEEEEWGQRSWRLVREKGKSARRGQRCLEFADHDKLFGHDKDFGFYLSKIMRQCRVLSRRVT